MSQRKSNINSCPMKSLCHPILGFLNFLSMLYNCKIQLPWSCHEMWNEYLLFAIKKSRSHNHSLSSHITGMCRGCGDRWGSASPLESFVNCCYCGSYGDGAFQRTPVRMLCLTCLSTHHTFLFIVLSNPFTGEVGKAVASFYTKWGHLSLGVEY